ncbi:MAG: ribosome-associated translation inhibitor RaiA [Acidobacteriota bacterium]
MFTTDTELKVDYTGRNIEITDALREFTEERLRKVAKYIDDIIEIHVILSIEKYRHIAEVLVKGKTTTLSGQETTGDMYSSIGGVLDKIQRQAKKFKEKHWGNKRRAKKTTLSMGVFSRDAVVSDTTGRPRLLKRSKLEVKALSIEEAVATMERGKNDFLVFRNHETDAVSVVYKRKDGNLGLIEP